jgi:nitroimidazol reductase NimA-like FMN-containing flavoprotein (pyridoxamine 5'-phosphate oxidase superfamily)
MATHKTTRIGVFSMSMRRKEKEITEKVIKEEILRQTEVGRLGLAIDGAPYIVPLNFCYVKDKIYLHSHKDGKKMQEIRKNPYVCFEVDEGEIITGEKPCDYSWMYTSVIAYGKATIVEDEAERLKGLRLISNKYSPGKGSMITEELIGKFKHLWIVRIDVDEMTGKKSPA